MEYSQKYSINVELKGILKKFYGKSAAFHEGQLEAIRFALENERSLIVERTGFGKSLVYFLCARYLFSHEAGVTIVVSPLLVLMENQMAACKRLGIKAMALNSTVKDRKRVMDAVLKEKIELLFITPEYIVKEKVMRLLHSARIAMIAVDEAHCISDWGHDFRLDYLNLQRVIDSFFHPVKILAVTATANERVLQDIQSQFGNLQVLRGSLIRKNLIVSVGYFDGAAHKYAWLLENIEKLPGSGIVYCIEKRECDHIASFLNYHGISAMSYYSREEDGEYWNEKAETMFRENKIKVIVATVKLGMGYDKSDIGFVIHYRIPSSIVAYYQQIGRAGRGKRGEAIQKAYAILMYDPADVRLLKRMTAYSFPLPAEEKEVLNLIESRTGIEKEEIEKDLSYDEENAEKILKFLLHNDYIRYSSGKYYRTAKPYQYNFEYYQKVMDQRHHEQEQMLKFPEIQGCMMRYVMRCLDASDSERCECCQNCCPQNTLHTSVQRRSRRLALKYLALQGGILRTPTFWDGTIEYRNEEGLYLSEQGENWLSHIVRKHRTESGYTKFTKGEVRKCTKWIKAQLKQDYLITKDICITSIPSSDEIVRLVKECAKRCHMQYRELFQKRESDFLSDMEGKYQLIQNEKIPSQILLVDMEFCTGRTLASCGFLLKEAGCRKVYPLVLTRKR